jgi:antitoxin MazE
VAEAPDLKEGDGIPIEVGGKQAFEASKSPDGRGLLAPLRKYRGRLPEGFKFGRLEANERG